MKMYTWTLYTPLFLVLFYSLVTTLVKYNLHIMQFTDCLFSIGKLAHWIDLASV
jgi:hypothetical protein